MSYAPGVVNRSGELLAQGISGAGQSLADTINTLGQQHRQAKAYRAMAVDGLGMDPEQVDKLSLDDLTGIMQGEALKSARARREAQVAETKAKTEEIGQKSAEDDAFAKWAQSLDTNQDAVKMMNPFQRASVHAASGMGPTNARAAAAIMRTAFPNGAGDAGEQPQEITSATGNHWMKYKNTLLNDNPRQPVDESEVPAGYTAVPDGKGGSKVVRSPGQKSMPPSAQNQLTEYLNSITSANSTLNSSDDELKAMSQVLTPAAQRAAATKRLQSSRQSAKGLLDMQKTLGTIDDGTHQTLLQTFGAGTNAPAANARIPMWDKNGKAVTLPAAQKDAAVAAGYSLTPPQ